jgi:hypothetical protein
LRKDIRSFLVNQSKPYVAYAWNGSRFDSYVMMKILKQNSKDFYISNIIINSGNELLNFTANINDKKISFRDPKKLFNETLEEASQILGVLLTKNEVNHDAVEEAYYEDRLKEYILQNCDIFKNYVRQDVQILQNVTMKIKGLYSSDKLPIRSLLTRSMAASLLWKSYLANASLLRDVTFDPYDKRNDIMNDAVGGRSQCVKSGVFHDVGGIDVKSMYPYVCATELYPCSTIVSGYEKGKLGIYYVKIIKQSYPHVIPYRKNKHSEYDWNYQKPFCKYVTSVDLEQIDEYEILDGFQWEGSTKEYFSGFMNEMYNRRKNAPNKGMNLHMKLIMNSMTGSIFQKPFREMTMIITQRAFQDIIKKYSEVINILMVEELNTEEYIIVFKPVILKETDSRRKMQREFCKTAITTKPWVLTMFTYSYARKKLREKWIDIEKQDGEVLYCDTDSLYFDKCSKVTNIKFGEELGDWEKDCWNDTGAFHSSKCYAIKSIDKIRIKGVHSKSQVACFENAIELPSFNSYKDRLKFFLEGREDQSLKLDYDKIEKLVNGYHMYAMNFYMEKNRVSGITKRYTIKYIAPNPTEKM